MPRLVALVGIFMISFSGVFVRLASVSPATAAFFRTVYALPFLALVWWWWRERDARTTGERWLSVVAGIFLGLDLTFWHHAIDSIGIGLATVLGNTQVAFVGLLAWLLLREKPPRRTVQLTPLVFAGVILVSGLGRADAYGEDPFRGVVYGLLTGVTYAAYLLLLRRSNKTLSLPVGPLLDATFGAAVASFAMGLADGSLALEPHWPAHGWLFVLALSSQVVGWQLITVALPRLPALETSVMLLLQPMLTVLWGYLLFAEHLSPAQWAGVALVLTGVTTLSVLGARKRRDSSISVSDP